MNGLLSKVLGVLTLESGKQLAEQLRTLMESRAVIEQAKGVLMVRLQPCAITLQWSGREPYRSVRRGWPDLSWVGRPHAAATRGPRGR